MNCGNTGAGLIVLGGGIAGPSTGIEKLKLLPLTKRFASKASCGGVAMVLRLSVKLLVFIQTDINSNSAAKEPHKNKPIKPRSPS